jgi:hypothetical protein
VGTARLKQDVLGGRTPWPFPHGTDFSFASTNSLGDIMKAVNASAAGRQDELFLVSDSFSLTSNETAPVERAG